MYLTNISVMENFLMRHQGVMLCNDIDNIFVFSIHIAGEKRNIFRQHKPFFWSELCWQKKPGAA